MDPIQANRGDQRFDRLRRTRTFRRRRLDSWCAATLGIAGAGVVGARLAAEAVLSGASVRVHDFDVGQTENQGTQPVRHGVAKVESVVAACDAILPGRAVGCPQDVRHAGVGQLRDVKVLVDCSDDPALAVSLTRLSNGLGIPLLRLALDGTGTTEIGRVLCSHGGAGHSCQMCTYDFDDLYRYTPRTPCPGGPDNERAPTIAGGALGATIAGCGLLQAQRLVTGNDVRLVLDREIVLDLSHWQLLPIERQRCDECLSGHRRWCLVPIGKTTRELTLIDLFGEAQRRLGHGQMSLEPYGHALCTEATCACGGSREAVGTRWAPPPRCAQCSGTMDWLENSQLPRLTKAKAAELGIDKIPLTVLGLPAAGAMCVARPAGKPPLRLVLD